MDTCVQCPDYLQGKILDCRAFSLAILLVTFYKKQCAISDMHHNVVGKHSLMLPVGHLKVPYLMGG